MELNKELYIKGVSDYLENGLNLFDGTWESGSINNSGADTSSTTSIRSNYVSIAPNTSYYFSSITSSEVSELWANYYSNGVFASREYLGVTNSKNFTTPAGVNQVRFRITFSDTVTTNVISNVMLNKGSIQLPYEPYRKYVTEDYLKNGKNKANIPTHTIAGQGTDYRIVDIEENTTYTLSCVKTRLSGVTITNGALIMFLKLDFYNGSTKISSATLPSAVSFTTGSRYLTYTFTTPANCDNILLNLGNNNGDNNKNTSVSRVMLNKGSTALPYEEYYGKYLNNADVINGILSNNQMWRFKSFSLSGATSYDLTFDSIDDLGQFSIVIINTITSSNSSTKIGFCRNFSTYSYSNIFEDHTGTDVITNVSRTAGNILRITTSTTSSIVVGVTYMRIFRQELNYR